MKPVTRAATACLIALLCACSAPETAVPATGSGSEPGAETWSEVESESWRLRWRSEPHPPRFQETSRLVLEVEGRHGSVPAELRADAGMPDHGHGLLRHPQVESVAVGRFTLENLYLHMPGTWIVYLDVGRDGIFERLEVVLEVD